MQPTQSCWKPISGNSGNVTPLGALVAAMLACVSACAPSTSTVPTERVSPALLAASELSPLTICDTLESLVAAGRDTPDDREFAYSLVAQHPVRKADDAFARAAVAGRLAQTSGLSAPALVEEVERYARQSMRMDPSFRKGAAQRMLGTLYVLAPGMLLEHGDSERGLELLEQLADKWPEDVETRLRLAEAYVALDDPEPAFKHLCFCLAHRGDLRPDDRQLLERLVEDAELPSTFCPG